MMVNIPKNMISIHMMVCKSLNFLSLMYDDHIHSENNTGKVPIAKSIIANHHSRKLPVFIAINCMESVNPHGKKNVKTPINGANTGFFVVSVFSDRFLGK